MVGIVLVSHSLRLAEGLSDLLTQIGSPSVPIVIAAGTADGRLGTNPDRVAEAIAEADCGDGVLVVPDLGSAVLSVKVALETVEPVHAMLVDAPFVEGAVAATVAAASGGDLTAVAAAATEARGIPKL